MTPYDIPCQDRLYPGLHRLYAYHTTTLNVTLAPLIAFNTTARSIIVVSIDAKEQSPPHVRE